MKRLLMFCLLFGSFLVNGQVNLNISPYTQNFNDLANTGTTNAWSNNTTIAGWYSNRTVYLGNNGSSNSGGQHSLGTNSTTERALGSLGSGSANPVLYGVLLTNNTGQNLSALTITYKGEQWRSSTTTQNKLTFSYKLSATTITEAGFTNVTTLDYTGATPVASNGAIDGNANAVNITYNLPVSISIGQTIMLRWSDIDDAGADAALSIDDLTVTAVPVAPTLTTTLSMISDLNYFSGNGPSMAKSFDLSGSALSPSADNINVIIAPTNFEISLSASTGFADFLSIPYTGGSLPSTPIYARLKSGLSDGTYSDAVVIAGGSVMTSLSVTLSGTVSPVVPVITVSPTSISGLAYAFGSGPSTGAVYAVSGTTLSPVADNIYVAAPTNFELSTTLSGTYSDNLTIPYTGGTLSSTNLYVRLKAGLSQNTYSGNVSHAGGGAATAANLAVSGVVGADCGTPTSISTVRATITPVNLSTVAAGVIVSGTVTAIFGPNKFYVQDASGGIAVFTTGIVTTLGLVVGDEVKITGTSGRRNGEAQISLVTCSAKLSSGTVPAPVVFNSNTPPSGTDFNTFLAANEGKLIKVISSNILSTGTFSAGTSGLNYSITTCNFQGGTEIRVDPGSGTLVGSTIPTVTQDIAGIVGRFITADGGTDKLQIFPRNASDLSNSAISCTVSGGCGVTTFVDSPTQLDVFNWNIEWIGHPANGPSQSGTNDATQIANAQTVLNSVGADVYMLQEICQYNSANPTDNTTSFGKLVQGLNTTFGANTYSGECSSAVSGSVVDANPQRVCIIYKNSVVTKVFSRPMFDGFTPATYPPTGTPSQFWASGRKPFMFMAKVNINSQPDTILFVGLHAKAGSAIGDYNRRKYDVRVMYDTLQAQYPTRKTIVLGDLNDDTDKSIASNATNGQLISSYAPFLYVNPNETAIGGTRPNPDWNPISKTLSDAFCASTVSFSDYIDHQIVSNEMIGTTGSGFKYVPSSVTSFRPVVANYATTTSDHYPTVARYQYLSTGPATITSIGSGNWSSTATWDCGCVPNSASDVVINTGNTVTVNVPAQAKSLNVKGILSWAAAFTLSLGM